MKNFNQIKTYLSTHLQMNRKMWLIVLIAFGLRLLLFIAGDGFRDTKSTVTRPDSEIYISSAKSIATTGDFNSSPASSISETKRPVGYPYLFSFILSFR
jgi:hypothetical protein